MTLLPPNHWRLLQLHKALEVMMSSDAVVAMSSSHLDRARRCLTSGGSALHCCCHKMKEREDGQCSEDGREGGREGGRKGWMEEGHFQPNPPPNCIWWWWWWQQQQHFHASALNNHGTTEWMRSGLRSWLDVRAHSPAADVKSSRQGGTLGRSSHYLDGKER
ncbi:hypothetical protein TcWFU_002711 [Taenia crassiceps]|uniref:Uncharacterized protein n=1 Tax=Taenia crassiceps TaxID=6207 RepID=A0ABR4Q4M4_9CEST